MKIRLFLILLASIVSCMTVMSQDTRLPEFRITNERDGDALIVPPSGWQADFAQRLEFQTTNRLDHFGLVDYWDFRDGTDRSDLLRKAFERAGSDFARDWVLDLPVAYYLQNVVAEHVGDKIVNFARHTFSGREEVDQFSTPLSGEWRLPFAAERATDGLKTGLRPFSTSPYAFIGYVADEDLWVQIKASLGDTDRAVGELSVRFSPAPFWSIGAGVTAESQSLWNTGIVNPVDHPRLYAFFGASGRLCGGSVFASVSFPLRAVIGYHRKF